MHCVCFLMCKIIILICNSEYYSELEALNTKQSVNCKVPFRCYCCYKTWTSPHISLFLNQNEKVFLLILQKYSYIFVFPNHFFLRLYCTFHFIFSHLNIAIVPSTNIREQHQSYLSANVNPSLWPYLVPLNIIFSHTEWNYSLYQRDYVDFG